MPPRGTRGQNRRPQSAETERKIAQFILDYSRENNGLNPSIRDVAKCLGVAISAANYYLTFMEETGKIYPRPAGVARAIRLTPKTIAELEQKS